MRRSRTLADRSILSLTFLLLAIGMPFVTLTYVASSWPTIAAGEKTEPAQAAEREKSTETATPSPPAQNAAAPSPATKPAAADSGPLFHDSHFHLTNFVQEGIDTTQVLDIVGDKVGRFALFGIPLIQKWDYFVDGQRRPRYYLESDSEMYYYSFVDALIAQQYLRLKESDRKRFDPFIVGFNPTDMNGKDHIRNVLLAFPGVFVGVGEFSIHKELVSSRVTGHVASLHNPAIDGIFEFAAESGLIVLIHCDIDEMRPTPERPAHIDNLKKLFARHSKTSIIHAHTGLGRYVGPSDDHLKLLQELLDDPNLRHVAFDISWDEVAKWVVKDDATIQAWAKLLNAYPDRFLFGSDAVAPRNLDYYMRTYKLYDPLWKLLTPEASEAIRLRNYERLIDAARVKVRAWEAEHAQADGPVIVPFGPKPVETKSEIEKEPAEKKAAG
jgi:predicted TIM-barrel fold metal-dependent hydrolase